MSAELSNQTPTNKRKRIAIIGAGPAGIVAAIYSSAAGAETTVFEKMQRPARKLCITGKGRCNITNSEPMPEFINHFGTTKDFLIPAFETFFSNDIIKLLADNGIETTKERGGRIFPANGKAPEVAAALLNQAVQNGAVFKTKHKVKKLLIKNKTITGLVVNGRELNFDAVIIATGGKSYPATGSTGDGFRMAQEAGHTIISPRPALVPLETANDITGKIDNLNLRNVRATLSINKKEETSEFGEMTFTSFGISGPIILSLSGKAVTALQAEKDVEIKIDLKPALNNSKLRARLERDFIKRAHEPIKSILRGLLPKQLIKIALRQTGIPAFMRGEKITEPQKQKLLIWLKNFTITITGYRPFEEAIITAGGIATNEVAPETLQSKKVAGLYFAGEVLDIQADTGGYNLQAAFSTGCLAAISANKNIHKHHQTDCLKK